MKQIQFIAHNERVFNIEQAPLPSVNFIPKWFKNTQKYERENDSTSSLLDFAKARNTNAPYHATMKMCQPFLDTMTFGYMITLPATVIVTQQLQIDGTTKPHIQWNTSFEIADLQDPYVANKLPKPQGFSPDLFRWINNWKIQTPLGYSVLITHPTQQYDLPFHTLTGLIDTDKHINPIVLPFFVKEGFEGEITEGTPIAQVFPFRRDNWQSKNTLQIFNNGMDIIKQKYQRVYKTLYWTKKSFK